MSDNQSEAEEPSIEEILTSIRQIISDDDEEVVEDAPIEEDVSEPEESPGVEEPEQEDDVLELTDAIEDEVEVDFVDVEEPESIEEEISAYDEPEEEPPVKTFEATPSSILSESAQAATMSSLSKLVGNMPLNRRGYDGITLEDIVRELLNPMLRDWMDDNLPPMVERIVQKELDKLTRRMMDE